MLGRAALEVQPRHLKALLRRAACRMELEEWEAAIADYDAAHNIEPDDQAIKGQLRQAKLEQKKAGRKSRSSAAASDNVEEYDDDEDEDYEA